MAKDRNPVQEKDGKMLSLRMQERCWECEDGTPLLLIARGQDRGGQGSTSCCSAIGGGAQDTAGVKVVKERPQYSTSFEQR